MAGNIATKESKRLPIGTPVRLKPEEQAFYANLQNCADLYQNPPIGWFNTNLDCAVLSGNIASSLNIGVGAYVAHVIGGPSPLSGCLPVQFTYPDGGISWHWFESKDLIKLKRDQSWLIPQ